MTAPPPSPMSAHVRRDWKSAFVRQNWAPVPQTSGVIGYVGPGIAEIKPHVGESIRDGLQQLREELADRKIKALGSNQKLLNLKPLEDKADRVKWFKGRDVVLLTYLFKEQGVPTSAPTIGQLTTRQLQLPLTRKLTVFALRPRAKFMQPPTKEEVTFAALKKEIADLQARLRTLRNPTAKKKLLEKKLADKKKESEKTRFEPTIPECPERGAPQAAWESWVKGLGTWYLVNEADLPSHLYDYWLTSLGPAGRGTAFEPAVRQAFIETIHPGVQAHDTWVKAPITAGPDVVWREVAEYLYELAGELAEGR
jgi:hypothetical protein